MTALPPARLKPFESRALTTGELRIARFMFADERPFGKTRIVQLPRLGFGAMAPMKQAILFSAWNAPYDFAAASLDERGWFVHEMTHIWQALRGAIMPLAKVGAIGSAAYKYKFDPRRPFSAYNIEQQAEIGRHLFMARNGKPVPEAPPREALEDIWPIRREQSDRPPAD